MGDLFIYACIPLFVLYFYLFQRAVRALGEPEGRRFVSEAGQPCWHLWVTGAGILLLLAVRNAYARAAIGSLFLAGTAWASAAQHRKLRVLGFDGAFTRRLARISWLSGAVLLLFVTGMVLNAL